MAYEVVPSDITEFFSDRYVALLRAVTPPAYRGSNANFTCSRQLKLTPIYNPLSIALLSRRTRTCPEGACCRRRNTDRGYWLYPPVDTVARHDPRRAEVIRSPQSDSDRPRRRSLSALRGSVPSSPVGRSAPAGRRPRASPFDSGPIETSEDIGSAGRSQHPVPPRCVSSPVRTSSPSAGEAATTYPLLHQNVPDTTVSLPLSRCGQESRVFRDS